jgi:hypothetical protein
MLLRVNPKDTRYYTVFGDMREVEAKKGLFPKILGAK